MWPIIKEELPDAELHIFYGWKGIRRMVQYAGGKWVRRNAEMRTVYNELVRQDDVYDHGMVPQAALANAMMRSAVHAAPWDFEETDGNTFRKMMAAGVVNVCPPLAGIAESAKNPETLFVDPKDQNEFVDAVFKAVKVPEARRQKMAQDTIETGCLEARLPLWRKVLDG
jgi:glycosyltransferase involved in cell wall biosynthesis